MPYSYGDTTPSVVGYIGYSIDPTPNSEYTNAEETGRATPDARDQGAIDAFRLERYWRRRDRYALVIPASTALTGTVTSPSVVVGRAGTVANVLWVPDAAVTGVATNNRTINLVNKGTGGAGTTVIFSLNFAAATNATVGVPRAISTAGTAAVAAGEQVRAEVVAVGTGMLLAGGTLYFDLTF